jgi:hypothetical protein
MGGEDGAHPSVYVSSRLYQLSRLLANEIKKSKKPRNFVPSVLRRGWNVGRATGPADRGSRRAGPTARDAAETIAPGASPVPPPVARTGCPRPQAGPAFHRSPRHQADVSPTRPAPGAQPARRGARRQSVNRDRDRVSRPWQWIREPGCAGFFRGSVLFLKGLHHVVCILGSIVDDRLRDSVAAPSAKTHPLAALGPAAAGHAGGPEAAQHLHGDQPE